MKTKINSAYDQIRNKCIVESLSGKVHLILSAATQIDQFRKYADMIEEELDIIIDSFTDEVSD